MEPTTVSGKEHVVSHDDLDAESAVTVGWIESVFDSYYRDVWRFVARMAGADVADDICGDVFAEAFTVQHRYDPGRGDVRPWLFGIALNLLRVRHRGEQRARRAFERASWQRDLPADAFELVDDAAVVRATSQSVVAAMAHLSASDRELLVLYAWEQLSYAEIAAVFRVPIGTVRSRLSRIRSRLRQLVGLLGEEAPSTRPVSER
jgi:RNA polymerase sigma factor (sigma-70 family)